MPTYDGDGRRIPRIYARGKAALERLQSLFAKPRPSAIWAGGRCNQRGAPATGSPPLAGAGNYPLTPRRVEARLPARCEAEGERPCCFAGADDGARGGCS